MSARPAIRWAALVAVGVVGGGLGCERRTERRAPAPGGSGSAPAPLPETTTIDWANFVYDLGSLGRVKATGGRAAFRAFEDDDGIVRATQVGAAGSFPGALEVGVPVYVDLDGDDHDEAAIPFVLDSAQTDAPPVFGAFVFTLRDGNVVALGTITTPGRTTFAADGATIRTGAGAAWAWDPDRRALVER